MHVSTAYSHCPRNEIKEQFYPVPITAKELNDLLKDGKSTHKYNIIYSFLFWLLSNTFFLLIDLNANNSILENWPNTYTFTKAITENMISTNENNLPISIFRPSISKYIHV